MKPALFLRLATGALFFATAGAGFAQTIAELPENRFKSVVEKTALYVKALDASRNMQRSYDRYASWVDVKKGPTGKERNIEYGVYDISNALRDIAEAGKNGPGMWPPLPNVDSMAQKLAEATTALAPLVKAASDYYGQHQYKSDGARRGQELHAQMMPSFEQVFAAEAALRLQLSAVREDVDRRNLAQIEREHGKNYEWHLRNLIIAARAIADLLPNHVDAPMIEGGRFKARFVNVEAAYAGFSQYCTQHPEELKQVAGASTVEATSKDFFGTSKFLRRLVEASKPDKQDYFAKVNDFAAKYDELIQHANSLH